MCVIHASCASEMILFSRDLLGRGSANIISIGRREGSGVESKCRPVCLEAMQYQNDTLRNGYTNYFAIVIEIH